MARYRISCEKFETTEYVFTYVPSLPASPDLPTSCGLQRGGPEPDLMEEDFRLFASDSSGNAEPSTDSDQDASASGSASDDDDSDPLRALRAKRALRHSRSAIPCEKDIDVERHSSLSEDSWASDFEEKRPNLLQRLVLHGEGVTFDANWNQTSEERDYKFDIENVGQLSVSSDGVKEDDKSDELDDNFSSDSVPSSDKSDELDESSSSNWLSSSGQWTKTSKHQNQFKILRGCRNHYYRLISVEPTGDIPSIPHTVIEHAQPTKKAFTYTRCQQIRLDLMRNPKKPDVVDEIPVENSTSEEENSEVIGQRFAKRPRYNL